MLQRSLAAAGDAAQQSKSSRRRSRADKVVTQIMGYAQLSEGRVEKLKLGEQINQAVEQVFPPAVPTEIELRKKLDGPFPALFMQRGHL